MAIKYVVERKSTLKSGVDEALKPVPPVDGARLVSVAVAGHTEVIFWWECDEAKVPDMKADI